MAEVWQGKGAGKMGNMPPAKIHSSTDLKLASLRPQKLALRAQTVCAAGAPLR